MKVTMTLTVKMMDSQRWICRSHLFQFTGIFSRDEPEAGRASIRSAHPHSASTCYSPGSRSWRSPRIPPRLDHLPPIPRRVTEAGVHGAVALHGLLRELHAARAQPLKGNAAVVDDEHERGHGPLRHDLAQGLRGRRVDHRRLRREQAELEGRLLRMLHREPAIVAVPRVGVDAESELLDIELEGFLLIANV